MSPKADVAGAYPLRTQSRLQTRDRVFAAALAEFRRVGVAAAQIEDIVRLAGVARGTFYLHFPTKDHVLLDLVRRNQARLAERLTPHANLNVKSFLRRLVDLVIEDAQSEEAALWHELFSVLRRHASAMRAEDNPLVETMSCFFNGVQERGELRVDLSGFDLTSVFLPGVLGLVQMHLDDEPAELRRALYRVVDVFVRGTATESCSR